MRSIGIPLRLRYFHAKADEIPASLEFPSPSLLRENGPDAYLSFFLPFLLSSPPSLVAHRFLSFLSFPPAVSKKATASSPRHSSKRDARCSMGEVATLLRRVRFHSPRGFEEDAEGNREWRFSSPRKYCVHFLRMEIGGWVDQEDGQNFHSYMVHKYPSRESRFVENDSRHGSLVSPRCASAIRTERSNVFIIDGYLEIIPHMEDDH